MLRMQIMMARPEHRRQGLGREALLLFIAWCLKHLVRLHKLLAVSLAP